MLEVPPNATAKSLYKALIPTTAECVRRLAQLFEENGQRFPEGTKQNLDDGLSYHFRKLPFDGLIQTEWPLDKVERFIRANIFPPHTPAQVIIAGEKHVCPDIEAYKRILASADAKIATEKSDSTSAPSSPVKAVA